MTVMNMNAATAHAIRRSNSVIVSEGEPGGPVSVWVTIGRVKLVASTRTAAPCAAWTNARTAQGCGVHGHYASAGSSTESMTWTTPFEASMSVSITLA